MKQRSLAILLFVFEVALISFAWQSRHFLTQGMPLVMIGEVSFFAAFSRDLLILKKRGDGSVVGARMRFAIAGVGLFGFIAVGLGATSGPWIPIVGLASAILTLVGKLLTIGFVRQHNVVEMDLS